ncbi:2Fe-2S iron-sulfur cluster-binding protein [Pseudomaricurvus sp.]|uniref:2Fe-2S iron-sulfur cluster-binding protein n=1 Tax=Pseudomaricurvus sp. TaxID=2004510 RepID=UPI003F6BC081
MAARESEVVVDFQNQLVELQEGESVLEALLRYGHKVPNSCRAGLCQSCLLKGDESFLSQSDSVRSEAQQGLSAQQIQDHHFLSCCCFPEASTEQSLRVELPDHNADWIAEVTGHRMLSPLVLEVRLKVEGSWSPGQHVLLWMDDQSSRSYSIASHPVRDGVIVLHIRRHDQGLVSAWCHDVLRVGDRVRLSPPVGHCVYDAECLDKPLLLVATGTGLAPVLGILEEALARQHEERIDLFVGGREAAELYLCDKLLALDKKCSLLNVHIIHPDGGQSDEASSYNYPELIHAIRSSQPSLRGTKVFLCGARSAIKPLEKLCFFAGASRNDIISEEFALGVRAVKDDC